MAANNLFPSFLDTPNSSPSANSNNSNNGHLRLSPSSLSSPQPNQSNGNGVANGLNGLPINAGQQMDVNFLYQKVLELSEVLRENRERTQGIVNGAEELAVCCSSISLSYTGLNMPPPTAALSVHCPFVLPMDINFVLPIAILNSLVLSPLPPQYTYLTHT